MSFISLALALEISSFDLDPRQAREEKCLIETVSQEAAGEGLIGMAKLLETVLNRTRDEYRSNGTYCSTVEWPAQYSWQQHPRVLTEHEKGLAKRVVYSYLYHDATHLLPKDTYSVINPNTATDRSWYGKGKLVDTHGNHEFFSGKF